MCTRASVCGCAFVHSRNPSALTECVFVSRAADLEGLLDLLLAVRVLHLTGHHGQELGEVDGTVAVGVDFVDHVLQLRLSGVLTERAHDGAWGQTSEWVSGREWSWGQVSDNIGARGMGGGGKTSKPSV